MAKFNLTITGASKLAAITAARESHNTGVGDDEKIATDEAYIQFVMDGAVSSWERQFETEQSKDSRLADKDQKLAERDARIATLEAEIAQLKGE